MTQLSTLFTLLGLITYLTGRQALLQQRLAPGFILISLGIGVGTVLATLSKENGILLILYVLVLEATLLSALPKPRYWSLWMTTFIYAPLTLLVLYFTLNFDHFLQAYAIREFTMGERLLTEARVLINYLAKILLLQQDFGLFFDDYVPSRGLFTPPTTVLAIILIISLLISAWLWRRRFPIFSLAILWFTAGQVLESSFISLVLYFEHRNYLPQLGILFGLTYGLLFLFTHITSPRLRQLTMVAMLGGLLLVPLLTFSQVSLWGRPVEQAVWWASQKPLSRFAQSQAAEIFERLRDYPKVQNYYQQMVTAFPNDTGPYMLWLSLACRHPQSVNFPEWPAVWQRFQTGNLETAAISGLNGIVNAVAEGECSLSSPTLEQIFTTLIHNPHTTIYLQHLYRLYAFFQAQQQRYLEAVPTAEHSLELNPQQADLRLKQIEWLIRAQHLDEAREYVQKTRRTFNPVTLHLYGEQLENLERLIAGPSH